MSTRKIRRKRLGITTGFAAMLAFVARAGVGAGGNVGRTGRTR